jgi:SAM-dependent methyltransferase
MALPFAQSSFPELYERVLVGPLFRPWVDSLLDDVDLAPGERVLDIACGTGIVARIAADRLGDRGKAVGVDLSAPMLAIARKQAPHIDWRAGDAGALPLHESEHFDVVVSQQGLQFFPDKPAAARQMRQALAPGGRLAVSTWRTDEEFPVLLSEAGFHDVRSETVRRTIRFEDCASFVLLNSTALVGMSPATKNMSDEERARVIAAIAGDSADVVRRHSDDNGFTYQIGTNITLAGE